MLNILRLYSTERYSAGHRAARTHDGRLSRAGCCHVKSQKISLKSVVWELFLFLALRVGED